MDVKMLKSAAVAVIFLVAICLSVYAILQCVRISKLGKPVMRQVIFSTITCMVTLISLVLWGDYANPMNREVPLELYAIIDIPQEYALENPGEKFWHSAYEAYGLYAEARYFDPSPEAYMGFCWPDFNFREYTYIIVYGQQMKSLSYNVWDTIDIPVRTGAKRGYAVLDDLFDGGKVYIYRIPKMRIDNDP